jgi:hypothetical protein
MLKLDNPRIEDGKLYGITVGGVFDTNIGDHAEGKPAPYDKPVRTDTNVSLDGCPLTIAIEKWLWSGMKVKGANYRKKHSRPELMAKFHNKTMSWDKFAPEKVQVVRVETRLPNEAELAKMVESGEVDLNKMIAQMQAIQAAQAAKTE